MDKPQEAGPAMGPVLLYESQQAMLWLHPSRFALPTRVSP